MLSDPLTTPVLTKELELGEAILWSGKPHPLTSMTSQGGLALFAVAWLAMSGAGFNAALKSGETFGIFFWLAFVGVGAFLLARPLFEYRRAKAMVFAITGQRLIIASGGGRSVKSIKLSGIGQVERIVKRGRITIRIPTGLSSDGEGGQKVEYTDLHGLRDGEGAYRLLTQPRI